MEDKSTANEYINMGRANIERGNYKEAIADYDTAIELNPSSAKAYNNRGVAKYFLRKYKDSIPDFDRAIELNNENPDAYNNRANAKADLGDLKGAIFDYDKAIELKPNYPLAYLNRAEAKARMEDFEGAMSDYNKLIKLKPKLSRAYNGRAIIRTRGGDFKGAMEDLEKTVKLKVQDEWTGEFVTSYDAGLREKTSPAKRKRTLSFDEKQNANTKDYKSEMRDEDLLNAILNLQLPTEVYLRLRILQRCGYKYNEAAKALGVNFTTLWETAQRTLQKLKKVMPTR